MGLTAVSSDDTGVLPLHSDTDGAGRESSVDGEVICMGPKDGRIGESGRSTIPEKASGELAVSPILVELKSMEGWGVTIDAVEDKDEGEEF